MLNLFTAAGEIILAMMLFLLKFTGGLCLIVLVMIVFVILFVFIVGMGYVIVNVGIEVIRDKYNLFDREVNENEERNTDTRNS